MQGINFSYLLSNNEKKIFANKERSEFPKEMKKIKRQSEINPAVRECLYWLDNKLASGFIYP